MDHWVADLAALTEHLDLRDTVHIGHSTGGGEVARYVARSQDRVAKAVLVAYLTPNAVQSETNPGGPLAFIEPEVGTAPEPDARREQICDPRR